MLGSGEPWSMGRGDFTKLRGNQKSGIQELRTSMAAKEKARIFYGFGMG